MRIFCFRAFVILFFVSSCIERGKPAEKSKPKTEKSTSKKAKLAHYTCPNGHAGSDKQGKCIECDTVLQHNQAYHGLNIPKEGIKDPFNTNNTTNTSSSTPAQNKYGDYHYICPNGHAGGAASNENCKVCDTKLTHNQLYHK